jgi:hypothetical protein
MKQKFVEKRFGKASTEIIDISNRIIAEYRQQGFRLSLRQLYYQLVARDFIPNSVQSYKRVGSIISDARDAGLIDWNAIEDRGRVPFIPQDWESPAQILRAVANGYRVDRWIGQENYVEVMVEKDALSGILRPVCSQYHVRFSANKGYSSSTAMYDAGQRFYSEWCNNKGIHLIYLGDHDPSGIDMTRDIRERLQLYGESIGDELNVKRIALNMDQVEMWNPPPNPAKETDSRYAGYEAEFGDTSWELDAVEPRTLADLVRSEIGKLIDWDQWKIIADREEEERGELKGFADEWEARKNGSKKKKK